MLLRFFKSYSSHFCRIITMLIKPPRPLTASNSTRLKSKLQSVAIISSASIVSDVLQIIIIFGSLDTYGAENYPFKSSFTINFFISSWHPSRTSCQVILGVLFFFLLSSILWDTRFRTLTLYVLGSLGTFIAFCSYVNLMIHRPRGLFLTLPASNQEKFAAILIEGIVVC